MKNNTSFNKKKKKNLSQIKKRKNKDEAEWSFCKAKLKKEQAPQTKSKHQTAYCLLSRHLLLIRPITAY